MVSLKQFLGYIKQIFVNNIYRWTWWIFELPYLFSRLYLHVLRWVHRDLKDFRKLSWDLTIILRIWARSDRSLTLVNFIFLEIADGYPANLILQDVAFFIRHLLYDIIPFIFTRKDRNIGDLIIEGPRLAAYMIWATIRIYV